MENASGYAPLCSKFVLQAIVCLRLLQGGICRPLANSIAHVMA